MKNVTDHFYIQQVKSGNIRYFTVLANKYKDMIMTVVFKIVESREDAEDITQEVFIKVFKSLAQYNEKAEFSTWLYRIAYNTTMSQLRKRKMFFTSIEDNISVIHGNLNDPVDEFSKEEKLMALEKALKRISSDESFLITLYYLDKQSIENISIISGIFLSNVKVKLHRIRKKLAVEINKILYNENR